MEKSVFVNPEIIEEICIGASGAELAVVVDKRKEYVLKVAAPNGRHIEGYTKEYSFYQLNRSLRFSFTPEVVYMEDHLEHGIILVMQCYKPISISEWSKELQFRAVDLCAMLNSVHPDKISSIAHFVPTKIDSDFAANSYKLWKTVLSQHESIFDERILGEIYKNIDIVCPILNEEPYYTCHGDFHPENILLDEGKLIICDWQNIGIGKSIGDISFFISRGTNLGVNIDSDELLDYYCEKLSEYKSVKIKKSNLLKERYASNVLNTLLFWAYHLNNCSREKVALHFNEMVKGYYFLTDNSV